MGQDKWVSTYGLFGIVKQSDIAGVWDTQWETDGLQPNSEGLDSAVSGATRGF